MTGQTRVTVFAGLATLLTALSFTPVFDQATWFWPTVGTLLLVGGVGASLRRRSVPAGLVIAAQVGAVTLWLTWLYADDAVAGLLPGPGAAGNVADLLSAGAHDARDYGPPVPAGRGIEFMTVLGLSAVALVVDALAVTFRRAAQAGLPLLALYTVPASVLSGVHVVLFILAATGYIALLIAEGRDKVSRWGRPLIASASIGRGEPRAVAPVETTPFAQVGRRIGAAVIGLAAAVPAIVPVSNSILGGGGGVFGEGGGVAEVPLVNPVVSLRRDFFDREERTLFRVETDDPQAEGTYYRMATLDTFDGEEWRQSRPSIERLEDADFTFPPVDLATDVPRTEVNSRITATDSVRSDHLPIPYPLAAIEIDGSWRVDLKTGNILSQRGADQIAEIQYETTHLDVRPTPDQLASASTAADQLLQYLELPRNLPPMARELAREVTEGAQSPWDRALRLQAWFTDQSEFTYDTSSYHDGWGSTALEQFLTSRRGYCEQFAATMAVMARALGIPARVNVGFTGGKPAGEGVYEITTKDLHAWPELYFEGIGWLRFEPTPIGSEEGRGSTPPYAQASSQEEAIQSRTGANGTGAEVPGGAARSAPSGSATVNPGEACSGFTGAAYRICLEEQAGVFNLSQSEDEPVPPWVYAVASVLLLALVTPAGLRIATRRRRYRLARHGPASLANAAWAELHDCAVDLGYPWPASETPRQTAARLTQDGALDDRRTEALARLAIAVERARYAPTVGSVDGLAKQVRVVRGGLAAHAGALRRLRAVVLPASTVAVARWVAERIADLLDSIDRLGAFIHSRMKVPLPR